jgi:hypothetical protein
VSHKAKERSFSPGHVHKYEGNIASELGAAEAPGWQASHGGVWAWKAIATGWQ